MDVYNKEVQKWQNVIFAARVFLLVSKFPTHTDVPTELGSPTSNV